MKRRPPAPPHRAEKRKWRGELKRPAAPVFILKLVHTPPNPNKAA